MRWAGCLNWAASKRLSQTKSIAPISTTSSSSLLLRQVCSSQDPLPNNRDRCPGGRWCHGHNSSRFVPHTNSCGWFHPPAARLVWGDGDRRRGGGGSGGWWRQHDPADGDIICRWKWLPYFLSPSLRRVNIFSAHHQPTIHSCVYAHASTQFYTILFGLATALMRCTACRSLYVCASVCTFVCVYVSPSWVRLFLHSVIYYIYIYTFIYVYAYIQMFSVVRSLIHPLWNGWERGVSVTIYEIPILLKAFVTINWGWFCSQWRSWLMRMIDTDDGC